MTKKVLIARSAGFCFGVKRAIAIADDTAGKGEGEDGKEGPIQSLGPIIHNPQAVERLQEKGVRVVESVDEIACGKVIIRSHGVTRSDRAALEGKGVAIVDATCIFVTKAQEHARTLSRNGYAVVVVGDPNHPPRTHHIETEGELAPSMVEGASVAGVTAGASTPQWIIAGFLDRLKEFWKCDKIEVSFYR